MCPYTFAYTHLYNWNILIRCYCLVVLQLIIPHYFSLLWQSFMTCIVTKATSIQFIDRKCHIKKQNSCKIALSGYYAWLVINALGVDTHTHTHTAVHQNLQTKQFQETSMPGLKIFIVCWKSAKTMKLLFLKYFVLYNICFDFSINLFPSFFKNYSW